MTTEKNIASTRLTFVDKLMSLLFILFIYLFIYFKFAKVMGLVSNRDRLGLQLSLIHPDQHFFPVLFIYFTLQYCIGLAIH